MSGFHRPHCGASLLALAFVVVTSTAIVLSPGDATARQSPKKQPQRPAPSLSVDQPVTAPARYFTINQVLAKRDASRAAGARPQFASTSPTMTDAPTTGRHLIPSSEPFGLSTFRAPEGLLWVKWRGLEQQLKLESQEIDRCRTERSSCSPQALQFVTLVERAQSQQGRARIEVVNRAINSSIRYTTDIVQHAVADLWTAPLATLASGRGDCEDYAIAKYVILRAAGVDADDLRLLLVRDRAVRLDHAVLAVREGGRWLILDNRHLGLNETEMLPHFTPLFALDQNGVNLFAAPYARRSNPETSPVAKLPPAAGVSDNVSGKTRPNSSASSTASSPHSYLL